jgi:hypothetical protein
MSLINDALKKAQKLHTQGQAPLPPLPGVAPGGSGRSAGSSRNRPLPVQIFALLALGAGVLIALSVLGTVYLLRKPAAAPAVVQAPMAPMSLGKPGAAPGSNSTPSSVQPPTPAIALTPAPALEKLPPPSAPTNASAVASTSVGLPVVQPPAVIAPPPAPLDPSQPDPKILAYIETLQVAGVRLTGTGSKALINDRVYREGDIIDRLLGLRVKKIDSDVLTFVDERGVIYTKNL